jgi:hypothetical protein
LIDKDRGKILMNDPEQYIAVRCGTCGVVYKTRCGESVKDGNIFHSGNAPVEVIADEECILGTGGQGGASSISVGACAAGKPN